jgi:hypothetical protein
MMPPGSAGSILCPPWHRDATGCGCIRGQREGRVFFFEKKNQKTFVRLMRKSPVFPHQTNEVFLLLFLQKKKTSCLT